MSVESLIDWITATRLSAIVLDTAWLWPVAESLHFMALVLMAGTVGLFDLRVLGLGRGIAPAVLHRLIPLGVAGFGVSIMTGILFISGTPDQYFYNRAFHFKLAFFCVMGANLVYFYARPWRAVSALGPHDDAPRRAKVAAAVSLAALVAVMCAGRMLTFYRPTF